MDEVYQVNRKKAESQKKKRYANNLKYLKLARKESAPITDESASLARIYLKHRLHTELETLPDNLRFHSSMYCKDSKPLPVMLAVITGPDGQPVGMHRTYLSKDGHKAPIPSPKMIMPAHKDNALRGAAIRLYEPDQTLIVAEGIETALSLHLMTGEPCWACISATGLQNVVIPETVKNILIGADNDEAGMRVARNLGKRLVNEGHEVTIRMPSEPGADWNDHLVKERA